MDKKKIMKIIIIIAVIIIPVMYSFFYLKAFWDPYGNLHDMNIAIVNLDEGDENENLGNELVDKIKEKDTMTIQVLNDSNQAQKGLINQEYYATITIPKDFTNDLNNAENTDRKVTTITYSPNQKSNYLASQIINKVVTTVETELRGEVSQKVVAKLSDKLREVPNKIQDISDGASKLQDGTIKLNNGIQEITSGTNELNANYKIFDEGIDTAYNGSTLLNEGISKLNNGADKLVSGTTTLQNATKDLSKIKSGVDELSKGSSNLKIGVTNYVDGVNTAINSISTTTTQVKTLASDLQKYASQNPQVTADANFQKVLQDLQNINNSSSGSQGFNTLKAKGNELKTGATNLNNGIQSFSNKANSLNDFTSGISTLNSGMIELKQGLSQSQTGSNSLNSGLKELNTNSKIIQTGISKLNDGSKELLNGSQTLLDGTNTFKTEIDNGIQDTNEQVKSLDGLDEYVKEPVKIEESDYAQIDSYGVGFAPYFMSISLWVGALIMLIIFYYDPEDRFKLLGRNAKNRFLRAGLYSLIAVTQGIVLGFLLKLGLGFSVTNIWLYYGTCILISLVFFSIIQFLVVNFGDVGKFLSILLLVLQLAASGGTFPIETVPKGFQILYNFMPMNYTIRLVKESIIKINNDMILKNVLILLAIFICFIGVNLLLDYIRTKKQKKG